MLHISPKIRPDDIIPIIDIELPEQEERGPRRVLDVEDAKDSFV